MQPRQKGFTIVELLIVIVVIAVLAAISLLAYNGIQARAQDASVRQDMKNLAKQVEIYKVDDGVYPSSETLKTLGIRVNKQTYGVNPTGATIFYCASNDGSSFSMVARVKSTIVVSYASTRPQVMNYEGAVTAPQLCLDSGVSGTTSTVNFTAFTENGTWYPWVRG